MIEQICAFIHNWFTPQNGKHRGIWAIENGEIELDDILMDGQYFRIVGSRLNDGVYTYPPTGLSDETFNGEIWDMRPPKGFRLLCGEIEQWQEQYGSAVSGPYQSESFGGYSCKLKSGSTASGRSDPAAAGWQGVFAARLNEWRKLA